MTVPDERAATGDAPAFYALQPGGWRDYVTLLHPPYTLWHLSYVAIGWAAAPGRHLDRLVGALLAFGLAVGVGAHALDELRGRPQRTTIPDPVLVGLAAASIGVASAIGVVGAITFRPWIALLVPVGIFLVVAYNLELAEGRFHTDLWFGLAWGGFPLLCGYAAVAGALDAIAFVAAGFAVLLSLAQRVLSNHVRHVRRRVAVVRGELLLRSGDTEPLDVPVLIASAERALRLLAAATVALALALVVSRL